MKNITVSVDDEIYRKARIRAAEKETSVSALVRDYLRGIADGESEFDRLADRERQLRRQVRNFSAASRLSRDELYQRRR